MKSLRLGLTLLLAVGWLHTAHAQTAPFEGLRFSSFTASRATSLIPQFHGESKYIFKCNTNEVVARFELLFDKDRIEDPETMEWTVTNLLHKIEGTNYWAVDPTSGTVGDLLSAIWVCNGITWTEGTYHLDAIHPFLGKGNVNGMKGVASEMDLVIAGQVGSTNEVVVEFTISATDKDTGLAIPDAAITLGSGVTNGVAWAKYADNTTNPVTPTITGHANWTANLTATIYRAEIWVDEIAWFGTDTNLLLAAKAAAAPGQAVTINAERVFSQTTTNAITGMTAPMVVGKWVTLRADPEGATKYEWGIGGSTVSNFTGDATSGGPVYGMSTNSRWVSFAWWKPGTNTITLDVTVGGMVMHRECKFKVTDPPGVEITTIVGNIALDATHLEALGDSLHFGDAGNNPGVKFTHNGHLLDGGFQWVQIIKSSTSKLKKSGNLWTMTASGLDTRYPYGTEIKVTDSPLIEGYYDEAGGGREPLSGAYEEAESSDSFTMYLMFKPLGGGVWVPIHQVDWDWNAKAVNGPGGWSFPVPPKKNVPAAIRATGWPTWDKNARNDAWWPE